MATTAAPATTTVPTAGDTTTVSTTTPPTSAAGTTPAETTPTLPPAAQQIRQLLPDGQIARLIPEVQATIPHDSDAFTQGLLMEDGRLYESTGRYGESTLRELDPSTGAVIRAQANDESVFAEGLELVDDRLVQLTWREEIAFVWEAETFELIDAFSYTGEGWGLCLDGDRLVMSDGSDVLTFRDPETFEPTGAVAVTADGEPVSNLNELECFDGLVMANVWKTNTIVIIDPAGGRVVAEVDATSLVVDAVAAAGDDELDVLNGVAYDELTGTFYVTGKDWPTMYQVRFVLP